MNTQTESALSKLIAKMLEQMANGILPWQKPWSAGAPRNIISGKEYTGGNRFMLSWFGGDDWFITFNQARDIGGTVNKGAKGHHILRPVFRKEIDDNGKEHQRLVGFTGAVVFAAKDCTLPRWKRPEANRAPFEPIAALDAAFNAHAKRAESAPISYGFDAAFYTPATHTVSMPDKSAFISPAHFYATLSHEVGHSLMSVEQRRDCASGKARFGSEPYAREELVAELFASSVLNDAGALSSAVFNNSAAYVQGWMKAIKEDPNLFISAAKEVERRLGEFKDGKRAE